MIFERLEKYYNKYKQYEESIKCRALLEEPLMIDYNDTKTILNEIERLNNMINILKQNNINEVLKNDLSICVKQYKKSNEKLEKYKSRIEKAVEYIETNEGYSQLSGMWEFYGDTDDLLNILRGKNK